MGHNEKTDQNDNVFKNEVKKVHDMSDDEIESFDWAGTQAPNKVFNDHSNRAKSLTLQLSIVDNSGQPAKDILNVLREHQGWHSWNDEGLPSLGPHDQKVSLK